MRPFSARDDKSFSLSQIIQEDRHNSHCISHLVALKTTHGGYSNLSTCKPQKVPKHHSPSLWAILIFMVATISSILQRAVLLRLRAFAPIPLALYSLKPVFSSLQAGGGPSGGLSCLYKCVFGVGARSFVPSVVPNVIASLLLPSDIDTIKRDVMGISYGHGFCFAIPSTSSACRWIPRSTRRSLQWPWMVPSWVPGMHRRRERIGSHDKKTEQCQPHKSNFLYIFQYSSKSSLTFCTLEVDVEVLKIPVIFQHLQN